MHTRGTAAALGGGRGRYATFRWRVTALLGRRQKAGRTGFDTPGQAGYGRQDSDDWPTVGDTRLVPRAAPPPPPGRRFGSQYPSEIHYQVPALACRAPPPAGLHSPRPPWDLLLSLANFGLGSGQNKVDMAPSKSDDARGPQEALCPPGFAPFKAPKPEQWHRLPCPKASGRQTAQSPTSAGCFSSQVGQLKTPRDHNTAQRSRHIPKVARLRPNCRCWIT